MDTQLVRQQKYQDLLAAARPMPELQKISLVNDFFNQNLVYTNDVDQYNAKEYWAALPETMKSGGGDCEDFAIAKYDTLRSLGVDQSALRITNVTSNEGPHMVLLYSPDGQFKDPLVLDNAHEEMLPLSQRPDLKTIYSLNDKNVFVSKNGVQILAPTKPEGVQHWREMRRRSRNDVALAH